MVRRFILRLLLHKLYTGKWGTLSMLPTTSQQFENEYKEQRYKKIEQLGPEGRRILKQLMELDVNYLNRKLHDATGEKALHMKGRIFQNIFYYSATELVGEVLKQEQKKN